METAHGKTRTPVSSGKRRRPPKLAELRRLFTPRRLLEMHAFRYVLTGAVLFLVDLAIFILCAGILGLDVRIAQVVSRTTGATAGFFGHKFYSFKSNRTGGVPVWAAEGGAYTLITLFNIAISPFVVYTAIALAGGSLVTGKLIAEMVLVTGTYLLLKAVFATRGEEQCQD